MKQFCYMNWRINEIFFLKIIIEAYLAYAWYNTSFKWYFHKKAVKR